jgi:dUTP pyrophosphatase
MTCHEQIDVLTLAQENADIPQYASHGASGADVKAFINEPVTLMPGETQLIPTGLSFAIPLGYEIQVRPRSGLALKHQIGVLNTPGTIDADYRGQVAIILINYGKESFTITPGMRIAQLVLAPVVQANFICTEELVTTQRGGGGFGHTGTH